LFCWEALFATTEFATDAELLTRDDRLTREESVIGELGGPSARQKPGTQSSTAAHERIRITTTLCQVRNISTNDTVFSRFVICKTQSTAESQPYQHVRRPKVSLGSNISTDTSNFYFAIQLKRMHLRRMRLLLKIDWPMGGMQSSIVKRLTSSAALLIVGVGLVILGGLLFLNSLGSGGGYLPAALILSGVIVIFTAIARAIIRAVR